MLLLGIETSCDETAVGIVTDNPDPLQRIRANCVAAQLAEHAPYGGVVPEIAARAHLDYLDPLIRQALDEAGVTLNDLSGIAATCGPGLIGGVMVGAMAGKAIAGVRELPFIAVNHLEAHALSPRLSHNVAFPYLLLLVSGGHCQLLLARSVGNYQKLGGTIDDAVGECFDKGAKLLGLGYPGGPLLEQAAKSGNPKAFDLPRPLLGRAGCDFSFSGLKTALRILVTENQKLESHNFVEDRSGPPPLEGGVRGGGVGSTKTSSGFGGEDPPPNLPLKGGGVPPLFVANAAASLQAAIADILADRTRNALDLLQNQGQKISALVVAGGVASNQSIRMRLTGLVAGYGLPFVAPPPALCTDNGAMVAWAGLERLRLGLTDDLNTAARPRWPLDQMTDDR